MNGTQQSSADPTWWTQAIQSGKLVPAPDDDAPMSVPASQTAKGGGLPAWATGPDQDRTPPVAPLPSKPDPEWWSKAIQSGKLIPEDQAIPVSSKTSGLPSRQSSLGGIGANLVAGAAEGGWNALAALPNAANAITNLGIRGANAVTGAGIPEFSTDIGGEASRGLAHATGGYSPTEVPAQGEWERAARVAGQAPGQLASMALGGAGLEAAAPLAGAAAPVVKGVGQTLREMPLGRNIAPAMAGNALGQVGQDIAPEPLKPVAALAGNLLGAGGAGLAQEGAIPAFRGAANLAGRVGIGPKEALGGVDVTGPQARSVGSQINVPGALPKLQTQEANAARIAEIDQELAQPNVANPEDLQAERAQLLPQTQQIVPGSKQTLAQAMIGEGGAPVPSGSLTKVNALEQQARVGNRAPFIERETEQNSARIAVMQGQASPAASVQSVGKMFTDGLDALEAQQSKDVGAAASQRETAGGPSLGGLQRTEDYGAGMHGALTQQQLAAKTIASRMYDAVDPDGTMTANVQPAKAAATDLLKNTGVVQGIETGAELHPSVARMAEVISKLPDVVPFKALQDVYSQVSAAVREVAGNPLMGREHPMMVQAMALKDGIAQSIDQAVERAAAQEGGLQGAPGQALVATLAKIGETPQAGETMTPEQAQAYKAANANYREYKSTYRQGAVGETLATDRFGARKTSDLSVPAKYFRKGDVDPAAVGAYVKGAGGNDQALGLARDYLASELRHSGIVDPTTGAANRTKLAAWIQQRAPALDALGGDLRGRLGDVDKAQQFYDNTVAEHEGYIKDYQNGAAKAFLKGDPQQAVATALGGKDPSKFVALAKAVRGNPDAVEGLKRAVVDWLDHRMSSATAATETEDFLKPNVLRQWIATNQQPIKMLFGGQGLQNFEMVAADLRRGAQRPVAVAGARTSSDVAEDAKKGMFGRHGSSIFSFIIGNALGKGVEHFTGIPIGGEESGIMGVVLNGLRQHGIATVSQLRQEALLHPELARVLMERVNGKPGPVLMRRVAARLQTSLLANQMGQKEQESAQ